MVVCKFHLFPEFLKEGGVTDEYAFLDFMLGFNL